MRKFLPRPLLNFGKSLKRNTLSLFNKGDQVYCPICQSSFKQFGAYGTKQRVNARCHQCESLERHRLLWLYFQEKTDLFKKSNVKLLHIAPEYCFYSKFSKSPSIQYVPADLFPEYYPYKGITKMDITEIPVEDNYFDVIICNHVLEHIPDDSKALKELHRVMKPGGWGIFQVPMSYKRQKTYEDFTITDPKARLKAFGQKDHVRIYGLDYKNRLENAQFDVVEDNWLSHYSQEEIDRFRLPRKEFIYCCSKSSVNSSPVSKPHTSKVTIKNNQSN